MWGFVSKSETTMPWSEMPGMVVEDLTREGFEVNTRSSLLDSRVGVVWI